VTVSPERERIVSFPGLSSSCLGVVVTVSLVDTSALLAGGRETTTLAVLVDWLDDPVDTGITTDGLVLWVDENDFVVFVGRVLIDPVRVENTQVCTSSSDTLFSSRTKRSLVFQLVYSLIGGFTKGSTLWNRPLASSTTNTDTVDDVSLFGLVSETASFIGTGWS